MYFLLLQDIKTGIDQEQFGYVQLNIRMPASFDR